MRTLKIKNLTLFILCLFAINTTFAQFGKANKVDLPDSYEFEYIYKLKMTNKKDDVRLDYFLKKDANYFGFDASAMTKDKDNKMFMVMDNDLEVSGMFMEMMGKKIVQKSKLKVSDFVDEDDAGAQMEFKQIESKTILGYDCEGYVGEDEKSKVTIYITDDVPVSLSNIWGANPKTMPKNMNQSWMKKYAENGLMMHMEYEDKKKSKNNMTMECVGLEETDFVLNASEYGSMMGGLLGN